MIQYKVQNIQLVQLTNENYALRKGWIFYRFLDFDCIRRLDHWVWQWGSSPWFKDCQLQTKEEVLDYIEKYFYYKRYRIIPVDINEFAKVTVK